MATSIDKLGNEAKAPGEIRGPLAQLIGPISQVPGVVAIGLGGSRSIGTSVPSSDFDVIIFSGPDPQLELRRGQRAVGRRACHRSSRSRIAVQALVIIERNMASEASVSSLVP